MEILAPAGDMEALKAALLAGADAVYLGGRRFGARAFAPNFDRAGLRWARRVTRRLGRRLYVTLNTLVFERELSALEVELDFLEDLAPDAVIVQDLGVLETLARRGSGLARHLSTQAAWDGAGGAAALEELGVTRVVLPRETPLSEVAELARAGPFEVEVFVHGAHCYSVSGRCWWSAALGSRSGNRGTCAQPCRLSYSEAGAGAASAPLFSPRDLRLVERARELAAAGARALKIEGRMKDAAYVGRVVQTYRAALDAETDPTPEGSAAVHAVLDAVYGREWCEGFVGGPPRVWQTGAVVGELGTRVGETAGHADRDGRVSVVLTRPVRPGDGLAWTERGQRRGDRVTWVGPPSGPPSGPMPGNDGGSAGAGVGRMELRFRRRAPGRARVALFRTADAEARDRDPTAGWLAAWESVAVTLRFEGRPGERLRCRWAAEGRSGTVASAVALEAARGEGLHPALRERFAHLGGGDYAVTLDLDELVAGVFLPPSELKSLRRVLSASLDELARVDAAAGIPAPGRASGTSLGAASSRPARPTLRLWQVEAYRELSHLRPAGGWILPASAGATWPPGAAAEAPPRFWLPAVFGPGALTELAPVVAALPPGEVLCLSWEAFALAERFGDRRFRLDGTFGLTNGRAVETVRRRGIAATTGVDAPAPLVGATAVARVHPLVSISRFPPPAGRVGAAITDDKRRRFHLAPVGAGAWGLFLERCPETLPVPEGGAELQVDVFLPPEPTARKAAIACVERLLG